ncbi:MAG: hypothetical protein ACOC2Y_00620 [Spirochaetota bacterium]
MSYGECRCCGFWVLDRDRHCPDCGCRFPIRARRHLFVWFLPGAALVGLALFYAVVALLPSYQPRFLAFAQIGAGLLVAGLLIGLIVDKALYGRDRFVDRSLKGDERNVGERIRDIDNRVRRIGQVRMKALAGKESDKQRSMLDLMDNAQAMLERYRDRYEIELWKIEVLRWKNTLEPIAFQWQQADYNTCDRKLDELSAAIEAAGALLERYRSHRLSDLDEAEAVMDDISEYLDHCHSFYEGITARQAKLAINDDSPADPRVATVASSGTAEETLLRSRNDVASFVHAFEDLENEFDRIDADDSLSAST